MMLETTVKSINLNQNCNFASTISRLGGYSYKQGRGWIIPITECHNRIAKRIGGLTIHLKDQVGRSAQSPVTLIESTSANPIPSLLSSPTRPRRGASFCAVIPVHGIILTLKGGDPCPFFVNIGVVGLSMLHADQLLHKSGLAAEWGYR